MRYVWRRFLLHVVPDLAVIDAASGEEGVRLALDRRPDVVVMDLGLPDLDGLEATRRLRADLRAAAIPVIAVTGVSFEPRAALEAGCNGYLVKPVEPEALLREVMRVLRRTVL